MKILYHHRTRSKDGQYVHIEELTAALGRRGHEIVMVGPPGAGKAEFGNNGGILEPIRRHIPKAGYEALELAYNLIAFRRLEKAYLEVEPDLLYERYNLFTLAGVWLKRKYGVPLLLEVNSPLAEERRNFGGLALARVAERTEKTAWSSADAVLPVTHVLADRVRAVGVPGERISVIPNGIDWGRFGDLPDRAETRRQLGIDDRIVLGFVGFVRSWHGLERVVDLVAEADAGQPLHVMILGEGPALPELRQRAQERGIGDRVTFAGLVERQDIGRLISAFDVALQPAVVPYASPLKLFEYLALGRAVVAPATANIREILADEENALLFDPNEPGAFERSVLRLCQDPVLRERLGGAARQTIERRGLTWDENARRIEELAASLRPGPGMRRSDHEAGEGIRA